MRAAATLLAALTLSLVPGCFGEKETEDGGGDRSPVLATVGQAPITALDLKSFLAGIDASAEGPIEQQQLEQWLDERVLEEALYQESLRQGLDKDPETRHAIRQVMIGKLINQHLSREVWSKPISEAELQKYYDDHESEFNRPAQVRLADIFIAVAPDATKEEKTRLKTRAEVALSQASEARSRAAGLDRLIQEYSDAPQGYRKGDTEFFDEAGLPAQVEPQVARAAFELPRVGALHEGVIETDRGFHVIMLTGRRSAVHTPLDEVRDTLTQRMRREAAEKARKKLIEDAREAAKIRVDGGAVTAFAKELNEASPAGQEPAATSRGQPSPGDAGPPALP